jgi:diguanylate cyclase (GGDEF)-like protein/PAS domain S-box-containing protein
MQERSPDFCFQVDQVSNLDTEAYMSQSREQLMDEIRRLRRRVTELESQLTAQMNQEEIFRQITENIQEAFFICTADYSQLFYISPAYESIWERSCDSLYQNPKSWLDSIHPEDRNRVVVAIEQQTQGDCFSQEYRIIRPDGSIRWISARSSLIRNQAGAIHRIAGIAEDITHRKHTQNALNELVEFNQHIIASIQDGVIVYGLDFRYLVWNQAMEQMSGLQASAVLGKRPLEVFPFLEETGIYRLLLRSLAGETVTAPDTYFQIPETGKAGWTSARFSPFRDAKGNVVGVIGIIHDITYRKQAEQALEHRIQFERLLVQLSAEFINLKLSELDARLQQGLQTIATFAQVDWAWIYLYSDSERIAIKAYEWVAAGITSPLKNIATVPMSAFAWSIEKMRQLQPLFVPDIANLPPEAEAERSSARAIGAKSFLAVPMTYQGNLIGSLGFHTFHQPMNWSSEDINLFMMLGTIFASAILRRQNEFTNQAVLRAIPDLLIRFDRNGIYLDMVNPGQVQLLKQRHECIGKNICDILPPDLARQRLHYIQQAFDTGEMQIYEYKIEVKEEVLYEEARIIVSDENEALCIVRDISDRKRAEQERHHAEQALRQQVEQSRLITEITQNIHQSLDLDQILETTVTGIRQLLQADRVLFYSFEDDRRGIVRAESVADGWHSLLKQTLFDNCSVIQRCFTSHTQAAGYIITDSHCAEPASQCRELLRQLQVKSNLVAPVWQGDFLRGVLMAQQCAELRQWQQPDIDLLKQLANQVAIAIHQSELYQRLQSANQELQRVAALDGLTQVANRRRFDEYLEWQWQQLQRDHAPVTLILCDVDFFKRYNDRYGHQAGDDCLKQIAQAIEQTAKRPSDLVARYGGEEFVVVLPNTNLEGAVHLGLEIQAKIAQLQISHACSPVSAHITLSMGIASAIPTPTITPEDLIAKADQALYEAKSQGRNTYCVSNV